MLNLYIHAKKICRDKNKKCEMLPLLLLVRGYNIQKERVTQVEKIDFLVYMRKLDSKTL